MGFGGANSHVTLEEANPDDRASAEDLALLGSAQSSELIFLAESSMDGLRQKSTSSFLLLNVSVVPS